MARASTRADVLVHLDGELVFLRVDERPDRCEYRGTRMPSGRYARIDGAVRLRRGRGRHAS